MEISATKSGDHFFWWPNFIVTTVCYTFGGKKNLFFCETWKQTCYCSFSFVSFFRLFFFSPQFCPLPSLFFLSSSFPFFTFPISISSYPFIFLSFFLKPLPFLSRFKLRRSGGVCRCLSTGSNRAFSPSVCWPAGFPHRLSCLQFTLSVWTGELMMGLNFNDFSKYLSS